MRTIKRRHSIEAEIAFCVRGALTPPLRRPLGRTVQETVFDGSRVQPFVDHPSDDAIRDSLVEEGPKMGVRNRFEILAYVDVDDPMELLGPEYVLQSAERLVSRAARAEAIRAGQKVLFVDRSSIIVTARCATLSSKVGMPSILCVPSALGM